MLDGVSGGFDRTLRRFTAPADGSLAAADQRPCHGGVCFRGGFADGIVLRCGAGRPSRAGRPSVALAISSWGIGAPLSRLAPRGADDSVRPSSRLSRQLC